MQDEQPSIAEKQRSCRGRRIWWLMAGLVFLAAVGCAGCFADMPDRVAEADIRAAGGTLQRDSLFPTLTAALDSCVLAYGPVWVVNYDGPVTTSKLEPLTRLAGLKVLCLIDADGSDRRAWALLAELNTLRDLTTIATDICDTDLAHLTGLPALQRVNLWKNPRLTPAGVGRLRQARPDVHVNFE